MPDSKLRKGPARRAAVNRRAAQRLTTELRQPLTAASNYIGAASLILRSDRPLDAAMLNLDKAGEQILRAGDLLRQLRGQLGELPADPAMRLP